jgi:DNA-directed RNA polymerase subunit RPC12/RpoP
MVGIKNLIPHPTIALANLHLFLLRKFVEGTPKFHRTFNFYLLAIITFSLGGVMSNLKQVCRYCGSERVDLYRALNGIIVYECEACWKIWNNTKLSKIEESQPQ